MDEEKSVNNGLIEEKEMSFIDHLEALRWHLIRAVIALLICSIIAFVFMKSFFYPVVLMGPTHSDFITYEFLCKLSEKWNIADLCLGDFDVKLQNISVSGQFMTHLKSSFVIGFILSFPYIFVELWRFVSPALSGKEKKIGRTLIFWVSFLFSLGLAFSYFIIVPYSFQFFATYQLDSSIQNIFTLNNYISMVSNILIGSGLIFLIPLVIYFLSSMGIVTPEMLKKYRKMAVVIIFFLGAIITPPDLISQIMISIPILILYEISIILSSRVNKKLEKNLYD